MEDDQEQMDHNSPLYQDYINSFQWKDVRRKAINFYGDFCQACQIKHKSLDVHHKTYKNFGKNEPVEELIPLCRRCHTQLHVIHKEQNPLNRKSLWEVTEYFIASAVPIRSEAGYSQTVVPLMTKTELDKKLAANRNYQKKVSTKPKQKQNLPLINRSLLSSYCRANFQDKDWNLVLTLIREYFQPSDSVFTQRELSLSVAKIWVWNPSYQRYMPTKKVRSELRELASKSNPTPSTKRGNKKKKKR